MRIKSISIEFEQNKELPAWIILLISSQRKTHKIDISAVYSPFSNLMNFLDDILKKKPSNLEIDEEGHIVEFVAKNLSTGRENFHLILRNGLRTEEVYIEGDYDRKEFVQEFVIKLKYFLDNKFNEKGWVEIRAEKMPYKRIEQLIKLLDK